MPHNDGNDNMNTVRGAAALGLIAATLTLGAGSVAANPVTDCDFVPLRYNRSFDTGGAPWRAKANLRVYDLCDAGTIRGRVFKKGGGPGTPKVFYKRQLDQVFTKKQVSLEREPFNSTGWRPWKVTTSDVVFEPSGGYFIEIRIRWRVNGQVRDVDCSRVHDKGGNAFDCRPVVP